MNERRPRFGGRVGQVLVEGGLPTADPLGQAQQQAVTRYDDGIEQTAGVDTGKLAESTIALAPAIQAVDIFISQLPSSSSGASLAS